jgi:hypothetical protein
MALIGLPGVKPQPVAAAIDQRAVTSGVPALELEGEFMDILKSAEGGFPKSDVIQEQAGPNGLVKKRIASPRYQDIAIQCHPVVPKPLFDWIAAMLNGSIVRKNGAIITMDLNRAEQSRLQFNNAMLTEIGFPACDGASKEPGYLTLKWAPEVTSPLAGKGSVTAGVAKTPKTWSPANFRLTIQGLDCTKVSRIEALTVRQSVVDTDLGQARDFKKQAARLDVPNLIVSLAEFSAGTFYAWFQDMVIKGNSGDNNERSGMLEFLDPTMRNTLFTIHFARLGIFGFTPERSDASADGIKRVKAEMYCEQITISQGKV